ncbi:MAG: histidine phosphatase family protein [Ignavibacteriaceae bacterium]|nr:histidine phosphatase family protein [Ignavibacteriaceae bacterium]MCW9065887.1 histidine phosphatase family protein [Ignavibacteriaceae bacterium]
MKTIYLVRHAKSFWGDQSTPDFDRPLNKRGKRDAPLMGEILNDKKVKPDLIISSPAKRAKKTAIAIAIELNYPEKKIVFKEELYEATINTILKILQKLDEGHNTIMIFGHNPGLTLLNNHISNHYIDNIPTCGVVTLETDNKWNEIDKNSCQLLFFEYPKMYLK